MKFSWLAIVLILVGCGKSKVDAPESVGFLRAVTASPLTAVDRANINLVCNALKQKEIYLPQSVNIPLSFATSLTDCERNPVGATEIVPVMIQQETTGYVFKRRTTGQPYIFPSVQTTTHGVLGEVCGLAAKPAAVSPFTGTEGVTFVTTQGIRDDDCNPVEGEEVCLMLEYASIRGANYYVHTREWMKVRTRLTDSKTGFLTYRKKITKAFCGEGEYVIQKSILQ